MGKRSRLHKQAVIAGTEKPFRASPSKPKRGKFEEPSASEMIMERIRAIKKATGG